MQNKYIYIICSLKAINKENIMFSNCAQARSVKGTNSIFYTYMHEYDTTHCILQRQLFETNKYDKGHMQACEVRKTS